jgi:hypothetical protein
MHGSDASLKGLPRHVIRPAPPGAASRIRRVQPASLKTEHPSLYHTITVSALRTMLMPIAFPLQTHVVNKAITASRQFMSPRQRPSVALYLRLTDKQTDGGITREIQYGVDYVLPALERIAHTTKRRHRCILLLTDDDRHALSMLNISLKSRFADVRVLTRVSAFFGPSEDYNVYAQIGHGYFSNLLTGTEMAYAYFFELVVVIVVAALSADALIGVGSSGVSQLISQYMRYARRMDANALAVWEVDVLGISWTP